MPKKIKVHAILLNIDVATILHSVHRTEQGAADAAAALTAPCDKCGGQAKHEAKNIRHTTMILKP